MNFRKFVFANETTKVNPNNNNYFIIKNRIQ